MESSGVTPRVALDCSDLAEVFAHDGPVLSVYLTTEPLENAAQHTKQRWRSLRQELEATGATGEALDAVEPLLREAHTKGRCLSVFVSSSGEILHQSSHPDPPHRDVGRWAELPSLVPLIEWRQSSPPHVVVLIDRLGADLVVFEAFGVPDFQLEVEGDEDPVRKVAPGGWSQRRFQQRAENTWEANAKDVADRLARLAESVSSRVIVAAGDVRALQLMREALPHQVNDIVHEVDGSRSPDGSVDAIAKEAVKLVATAVAHDTADLIGKFREEIGQRDRAANGPSAVIDALCAGQVEALLIHDDPDDNRTAWIGPEAHYLSLEPGPLKEMGVDAPVEARLTDALTRAAVGTSARIRVVPSASVLEGAVGAILRWSNGNGEA
ncbi:MAG: hypothetical protein KY395_06190 [Actinobacteria bacterium]|nr:hypothetical protein [Actinomycetota bacterium]